MMTLRKMLYKCRDGQTNFGTEFIKNTDFEKLGNSGSAMSWEIQFSAPICRSHDQGARVGSTGWER